MKAFRFLLALLFAIVVAYTAVVVAKHGLGLFPIYFGDMARMDWPGQFNLDFMCFLILSGLWMAWRNEFSPAGLALGLLGLIGGTPMLSAYLLIVTRQADGDWAALLLGPARSQRARNAPRPPSP
jgi:hypothetical protein